MVCVCGVCVWCVCVVCVCGVCGGVCVVCVWCVCVWYVVVAVAVCMVCSSNSFMHSLIMVCWYHRKGDPRLPWKHYV